jgi:hypothetical protein
LSKPSFEGFLFPKNPVTTFWTFCI